jgi:hypothetical protein
MITINPTAIVVMPGQPFLDWLHRADPTSNELSLEDRRREPTVYLLPECERRFEFLDVTGSVRPIGDEQGLGGLAAFVGEKLRRIGECHAQPPGEHAGDGLVPSVAEHARVG